MKTKNIHFFTTSFPISNTAERGFIEPELPFLSSNFETVYIYPKNGETKIVDHLPSNVIVVNIENRFDVKLKLTAYFKLIQLLLSDVLANKKLLRLHNLKLHISLIKKHVLKKNQLKKHFETTQSLKMNDVVYTYWMDEWCTVLSLLKEDVKFNNKFISRAHGFDLYDERSELGKIPFRHLQLKNLDKVFAISKSGKDYFIKRNSKFKSKFEYSRLGVYDHGVSDLKSDVVFTIVSCSSITPVKRVHLIVELLANVKQNIQWIHFGDGPLRSKLEEKVVQLPKNVAYQLMGNVPNEEVLKFYKANNVNLFLNVSESEGIPVSIMEVISCSIPVMAFNVGGMSEILNDETGMLIENPNDLDAIVTVLNSYPDHPIFSAEKRKRVRAYWKENFDAAKNHSEFVSKLID